jgi:hypothetical protein
MGLPANDSNWTSSGNTADDTKYHQGREIGSKSTPHGENSEELCHSETKHEKDDPNVLTRNADSITHFLP